MKLREAEVLLTQGNKIMEVSCVFGNYEQAYYPECKTYGGLNVTQAGKLKQLENENARLKRLSADPSLENAIF